ncbi:plexin-B-like [Ptychodera flava]|uniref:plexin-B-like n=1 Tax=Ptychodera flava TaxID=63121 RepID=UPI003969E8C6
MTTMSCPTPELTIYSNTTAEQNNNNNNSNNTISRRRRSEEDEDSCPYLTSDPITGEDALFLVGFVLDGDSRWLPENIVRHLSSKYTHIDVIWNPIVYNFSDPQYPSSSASDILIFDPEKSAYLVIKGKGMDCGAQKTDVEVQIGTDFCRVISLYSNEMACIPPEHKPPVRNEYRRVHGHPQVLVQFGTFEKNSYFIGYLQYVENEDPFLDPWIVVIIVLIFLLILIILIAVIIFLFLRWRNKEHVKRRVIETVEIDHVYTSLFIGDDWRHDPYSYLDTDMKHDIETVRSTERT